MITTMRRGALALAMLAAVVGTAGHYTPAAAAAGAESHGPVRTGAGNAGAVSRSGQPGPAGAASFAVAPGRPVGMTGAHTSRPAHRSIGGIVAGVIVLAILVLTTYLLRRRRQRRFRGPEPDGRDGPDEPRG